MDIQEGEDWEGMLDERQRTAVRWAHEYTDNYNHGATGHNDLVLISKLAYALDIVTGFHLTFGTHKGKTFGEILARDSGYLLELLDDLHLTQMNPDHAPALLTKEEAQAEPFDPLWTPDIAERIKLRGFEG